MSAYPGMEVGTGQISEEGSSSTHSGASVSMGEERLSEHIPGLGTFFLRKDKNSRKRRRDFVNLGRSQRAAIVRTAYTVVESVCDIFCPGEKMELLDAIVDIHPTYRRRYTKRMSAAAAASGAASHGKGPVQRSAAAGPVDAQALGLGLGMGLGGMAAQAHLMGLQHHSLALAGQPYGMHPHPFAGLQGGLGDHFGLAGLRGADPLAAGMYIDPRAQGPGGPRTSMDQLARLAAGSLAELRTRVQLPGGLEPGLPLPPPHSGMAMAGAWKRPHSEVEQDPGCGGVPAEAMILHKMRAVQRVGGGLRDDAGPPMSTYPGVPITSKSQSI